MAVELTPAQFRILAAIEELGPDVSVAALTEHLGGHPNASRRHLAILEEASLISTCTTNSQTSGRPAKLYTITDEGKKTRAADSGEPARLNTLRVLASHLAKDKNAAETAYKIGKEWGESERDEVASNPMRALSRQGFAPSRATEPGEFDLLSCPVLDAAKESPEVICSLHRGYLDGALNAAETTLTPFATPRGCRVRITRK
ncbi:MAG: hypothetical protein Q4E01_02370 [Actinomycetaceae bacterium]|nr:hypothetical protein [Actinomycetaceae bacterium]